MLRLSLDVKLYSFTSSIFRASHVAFGLEKCAWWFSRNFKRRSVSVVRQSESVESQSRTGAVCSCIATLSRITRRDKSVVSKIRLRKHHNSDSNTYGTGINTSINKIQVCVSGLELNFHG